MRKLAVLLVLAMLGMPVFSADEPEQERKLTPQQEKMKKCNADAKAQGLKGDDFKQFRNECLRAK